jgi:hypothetical protein
MVNTAHHTRNDTNDLIIKLNKTLFVATMMTKSIIIDMETKTNSFLRKAHEMHHAKINYKSYFYC